MGRVSISPPSMARDPADGKTVAERLALWDERYCMERLIVEGPVIPSRAEFRRWAEAQPRERYERVAGAVVPRARMCIARVRVKAQAWLALDQAIRAADLACEALCDGVAVEVGDDTDYQPHAVVNDGEPMPGDEVAASNPVIVVEVLWPFTQSVDTGVKLADYFKLPSVRHYLIIRADRRAVIHYRRRDDGGIETQLAVEERIVLDRPGIKVAIHQSCNRGFPRPVTACATSKEGQP